MTETVACIRIRSEKNVSQFPKSKFSVKCKPTNRQTDQLTNQKTDNQKEKNRQKGKNI